MKWYSVTGTIEWFSNTNGSDYKGRFHIKEWETQASSKAAAIGAILERLKITEKWADAHWLGYSVEIVEEPV